MSHKGVVKVIIYWTKHVFSAP